jgi:histidinol-phosphate phosphatase family protein
MNNIVFLDRDGTVIVDPSDERVDREDKIKLFPDSIESLKYLADHNFSVIFVTNQAGIAEGKITAKDFDRIHKKVLELLAPSGIKILKTYVCPHNDKDKCECRKPKPTMLLDAAKEFNIDLSTSYMIGDHISDIESGLNAGTRTILVQTATNKVVVAKQATYTAPTLSDAVRYIAGNP